jgi:hypothetical protein
MSYFETSAKKGHGVDEAFREIATQVVDRLGKDSAGAGRAAAAKPATADKVDIKEGAGKTGGGGCCGKS